MVYSRLGRSVALALLCVLVLWNALASPLGWAGYAIALARDARFTRLAGHAYVYGGAHVAAH